MKHEKFYKNVHSIALHNLGDVRVYMEELNTFLDTQTILKRQPLKNDVMKLSIYFHEWKLVNNPTFTELYQLISGVCISEYKHVAPDSVVGMVNG
jgi:hypothetical protein